jgi:hypothetical protein
MAGEAKLASGSDEIRESMGHLRAAARPTKPSSITTDQAPIPASVLDGIGDAVADALRPGSLRRLPCFG